MNVDNLKSLLIESLNETYVTDKHLYENKLCERSKVFRIGLILSRKITDNQEYAGCVVDSEYNRRGSLEKIISRENPQYPDLLIHKRGDNSSENLLVIEFKVSSTKLDKDPFENDVNKLKHLTANNEYNYQLGAHVYLCRYGYIIKWYTSGFPEDEFTIYSSKSKRKKILEQPTGKFSKISFLKQYKKNGVNS